MWRYQGPLLAGALSAVHLRAANGRNGLPFQLIENITRNRRPTGETLGTLYGLPEHRELLSESQILQGQLAVRS